MTWLLVLLATAGILAAIAAAEILADLIFDR
jgi:hypothetical protein